MRFSTIFVTFALGLSSVASPLKRDAATVESDLTNIDNQVKSLDSSITAFPDSGGSLLNALVNSSPQIFRLFLTVYKAIHTAATSLDSTIKSATSDATVSSLLRN